MFRKPGPTCNYLYPGQLLHAVVNPATRPGPQYPTSPAQPRPATHPPPPGHITQTAFVGGAPIDEAKSLLRPCLAHGHYRPPLANLPSPLEDLLGTEPKISVALMQKYLGLIGVSDADLGGPLSVDLPRARYFVIHDTSYKLKNRPPGAFPSNINEPSFPPNTRQSLQRENKAHVFIGRTGISSTFRDFVVPFSATKYTNHRLASEIGVKQKFCHVEMIQPRQGAGATDWQAPYPGFPSVQIERLALVYVAASIRHKEWLIPAYHHNVDMGSESYDPGSDHDDPQNFDLSEWVDAISDLLEQMLGAPKRKGDFTPGSNGGMQG